MAVRGGLSRHTARIRGSNKFDLLKERKDRMAEAWRPGREWEMRLKP